MPDPTADRLREIHEGLEKIHRDIELTTERLTDSDLRDSVATFKARLVSLQVEERELRANLTETARTNAQASLLADVHWRLIRQPGGVVDLDAAADFYMIVLDRFNKLDLLDRRALVRGYVDVTVHHGRRRQHETQLDAARRRVEITHKLAPSLNEL